MTSILINPLVDKQKEMENLICMFDLVNMPDRATLTPLYAVEVFAMTCRPHHARRNKGSWTFSLHGLTERSMTFSFRAGHLFAPYKFACFLPTDGLYPPVREGSNRKEKQNYKKHSNISHFRRKSSRGSGGGGGGSHDSSKPWLQQQDWQCGPS